MPYVILDYDDKFTGALTHYHKSNTCKNLSEKPEKYTIIYCDRKFNKERKKYINTNTGDTLKPINSVQRC